MEAPLGGVFMSLNQKGPNFTPLFSKYFRDIAVFNPANLLMLSQWDFFEL